MLSFRTALFRSQPMNALTRQSLRVPHLVHGRSSHKPPTTFTGRTFSSGPKLLQTPAVIKEHMILNRTREEYLDWAGFHARHTAGKVLEAIRKMSARELRSMAEDDVDTLENTTGMNERELRSVAERVFEVWASDLEELEKQEAGEEYDAVLAEAQASRDSTERVEVLMYWTTAL